MLFFPEELGELDTSLVAEALTDLVMPFVLLVSGWFVSMGLRNHE
jgi:hypothetical protein